MNAPATAIQKTRKYKTARNICDEYGITPVTVWRWTKAKRLPEPTRINGRNYWPADVEPLTDSEVVAND